MQGGSVSSVYAHSPIEISGHYVFVANDKLQIFDAADPFHPTKVGEWTEGGFPFTPFIDVAVIGNTAWLSSANYGTQILDVSDPSAIRKISYIPGIGFSAHARRQNQLFTFEYPSINVFDVSDPTTQKLLGQYVAATPSFGVAVTGHYALLQRNHASTAVLDVTDPTDPKPVGVGLPEGFPLTISGTNAFLVDTNETLRIFDVSDPTAPHQIGNLAIGSVVSSAVAEESHLYVGISNRVQAVDVSNPSALKFDGSVTVPGHSVYLAGGDHRLVAASRYTSNYLSFISTADAAQPQVTVTITNTGYFGQPVIAGNVAYVPDEATVTAWDITDINTPVRGGSILLGSLASLAAHGARLHAVAGEVLTVIDISAPLAPKKLYELNNIPSNAGEIAINSDNYLFVTGGDAGLLVVELGGELPGTILHIINEGEMLRVTWPFGTLQSSPVLNNQWATENATAGEFFMEKTIIPTNASQFYRALQ